MLCCLMALVVILGTQYAGEMKKGIFTVMHYLMPKQGVLSLHSSANCVSNSLLFMHHHNYYRARPRMM